MNIKAIQDTIRYNIYKQTNKKIGYQSQNEIFVIMRSIYLQYANSFVSSDNLIDDIKKLNQMVTEYSTKKIKVEVDQHSGYIEKISKAPEPLDRPKYDGKDNYTYDISNLLVDRSGRLPTSQ